MTSAQIENALAQCGVRVGTFIPALDAGASENRLLMDCRDLSSAAITAIINLIFYPTQAKILMQKFLRRK